MSNWLIIPVKPLRDAKSRLSPILTPEQRYELARATLIHALQVACGVPSAQRVLVVSRDAEVLDLARDRGALTLLEAAGSDLNRALQQATRKAMGAGAEAILILPADLPFATPDDIEAILRLSSPRSIVIASDGAGDGSNALCLNPPDLIDPAYGPGSFTRHCQLARQAGAAIRRYASPSLALDIDTPDDLYAYARELERGGCGDLPAFDLPLPAPK